MSKNDLYNKLAEIYEDSESNPPVQFVINCSDPNDSEETAKNLEILKIRQVVLSYAIRRDRPSYNGFMNPRNQWLER